MQNQIHALASARGRGGGGAPTHTFVQDATVPAIRSPVPGPGAWELPAPHPRTINCSLERLAANQPRRSITNRDSAMAKFLLFCILFVLCWPLALLALVAYPIVWLLLIPFRILGIAVGGVLELIGAIIFLPARVLRTI